MANALHDRDESAPVSGRPRWLLARVRAAWCALPLEHVREICRPLPIIPLSGLPAPVLGTTLLRGRLVPVVDAVRLLSEQGEGADGVSGVPEPRQRFVSLRIDGRSVVLLFDEVMGVRDLDDTGRQPLPPLLTAHRFGAVESLARLDRSLVLVLSAFRVLPESDRVWRRIDQSRGENPGERERGEGREDDRDESRDEERGEQEGGDE